MKTKTNYNSITKNEYIHKLETALLNCIYQRLDHSQVEKWYEKYKDDKSADQSLIEAIKTLKLANNFQ